MIRKSSPFIITGAVIFRPALFMTGSGVRGDAPLSSEVVGVL